MGKVSLLRECVRDAMYIMTNNIIAYIPVWIIRKKYYQLCGMKIGKGSRILMGTIILAPEKIEIGERTFINEKCFLDGRGGLKIGNDVTVAVFSKIITGAHNIDDDDFSYVTSPVSIGDNVAIFADCVVLGGAQIQNGCVFSAASVVKKGEYISNKVYAGNPISYIRERKAKCEYKQDSWRPILR